MTFLTQNEIDLLAAEDFSEFLAYGDEVYLTSRETDEYLSLLTEGDEPDYSKIPPRYSLDMSFMSRVS